MNKAKYIVSALLGAMIVVGLLWTAGQSGMDSTTRARLRLKKPDNLEQIKVGLNNWAYDLRNDGSFFFDVAAGNFGGEFPRGSGYSGVFAAGIWIGGLKRGVDGAPDTVNVANVEFESEFLPGKIIVNGAKDDVYRGYMNNYDLSQDKAAFNDTTSRAELVGDDYLNSEYRVYLLTENGSDKGWPVYAPRRSNGDPFLVPGAAGQTYSIFNDLSIELTDLPQYSLSQGFGLEMELESFAFTTGALANGVFFKASITNKSTTNYEGAYISIWSDMDVGSEAAEDLANVDTIRGVAMIYSDAGGGDVHYIATGLDFLQGPLVNRGEVTDSLFDLFAAFPDSANLKVMKHDQTAGILRRVPVQPNQTTLAATSFTAYPNNRSGNCGQITGDICRYNYQEGLTADGLQKPGGVYDPFAGRTPADQRVIHSAGPFVLKSGVTQEIWMGFAGGQGTEHGLGAGVPFFDVQNPTPTSAVFAMYAVDDAMQKSFNAGLAAPGTPAVPDVRASGLDGKVALTWDNASELSIDRYGDPELLNIRQNVGFSQDYVRYDFQGYRVYKSLTALQEGFEQVAEYDLIDGITEVNDTLSTGRITYDIHIGTDNGIQHFYEDEDVVVGRTYYYSVTAYDYQPLFYNALGQPADIPRTFECNRFGSTNLKAVTPMRPTAGNSDNGAVAIVQAAGWNDAYTNFAYHKVIQTSVVNPKAVGGKTYDIEFYYIDSVMNGRAVMPASLVGQLAMRFIDTADVQRTPVAISNYRDDVRTYLDSNRNGSLDVLSDGSIDPSSGDQVLDDRYFSLAISTWDDNGVIVVAPPYAAPIVDGIVYKPIQPEVGFLDVYEVSIAGAAAPDPKSVLNARGANNKWSVRVYQDDGQGYILSKPAATSHLARTSVDIAASDPRSSANYGNMDYELRFTADGDTAFTRNAGSFDALGNGDRKIWTPFEIWQVGGLLNGVNDVSDDSHLVAKMGDRFGSRTLGPYTFDTLRTLVNKYYANYLTYAVRTPMYSEPLPINTGTLPDGDRVAFGKLSIRAEVGTTPADTAVFYQNPDVHIPPVGTVLRLVSKKPFFDFDVFRARTRANTPFTKSQAKRDLKDVKVVPNPYYGRAFEYQRSLFDKRLKFINLPDECTIRIFTVSGDLVRVLQHTGLSNNDRVNSDPLNTSATFEDPDADLTSIEVWDLRNRRGSFVASGMYIAVVEPRGVAKGAGKKIVKFAVIQEEIQVNGPDVR